jgi:uncharacterized RDD family membrane protein YckC
MTTQHTNTLRIATPDGVVFDLPLAGPAARGAALFIDFLITVVIMNAIYAALTPVAVFLPDIGYGLMILLYFAIQLLYGMTLEWFWGGRTIGKRLFQLRVIDDRGLRLRPSQVVLRNLMRAIDSMPAFYLVGGICCYFNRRCQRLGDLAAGTVVIRTPAPLHPPDDLLSSTRFNSFRSHPHLEARLRQLTHPQEVAVAIEALRRRESIEPAPRIEVFSRLADHFRAKLRFPDESTEGLTDEQYLRNIVDTMCRHASRKS